MKIKITTLLFSTAILLAGCADDEKEIATLSEYEIQAEVVLPEKGDHLYPSWIYLAPGLATVYNQPVFQEDVIEFTLVNPGKGTRVGLEMEECDIVYASRFEVVTGEEKNVRLRYPVIWKLEKLRTLKEETIAELNWQVTIDGINVGTYLKRLRCHSLNECITSITTEASVRQTKAMYAGYIEEKHPELGKLIREAVGTGIVPMFCDYQRGPEYVWQQLLALWVTLENRGITTHPANSVTEESIQKLRPLSEVLIDKVGSPEEVALLFTSLCQQLGFCTTLHTRPHGIYIGIADDFYNQNPTLAYFLDITQLNCAPRESLVSFQEALLSGSQMYLQDQQVNAENPLGYEEIWIDQVRLYVPSLFLSQQ